MPILPVHDRSIVCPYCNTSNSLVGSDLPGGMPVACSHCGGSLGNYADMGQNESDEPTNLNVHFDVEWPWHDRDREGFSAPRKH